MSKVLKQTFRALTADKKKLSIVVVLLAMLLLLWGRLLLKRVPRTAVAEPETTTSDVPERSLAEVRETTIWRSVSAAWTISVSPFAMATAPPASSAPGACQVIVSAVAANMMVWSVTPVVRHWVVSRWSWTWVASYNTVSVKGVIDAALSNRFVYAILILQSPLQSKVCDCGLHSPPYR